MDPTITTPSIEEVNPIEAKASKRGTATKRQIRGSSLLLFGQILSKGLNFFIQVLIVRYLTKSDYGAFAYALSIAALGETITTFGLDRSIARFAPIYHEREDYPKMAGTIVMALGTVLFLGTSIIVTFFALQNYIHQTLVQDNLSFALLVILIFMPPVDSYDNLLNGMFAVFSKPGAIFFRKYILGPALKILVVVALIVGKSDVRFLAIGYVLSGVLAIAIYAVIMIAMLRNQNFLKYFKPGVFQIPAKEILAFTIPLLTSDLVYTVMNTVDAIMVGYFHTTGEVAVLRAVQPTAKLNQLVLGSFALLFTPAAARMFARDDRQGINDLYWQNAVWISVVSFPIFALTFSLAKPITLLLFGERYEQSALILALLSFAYYFNAALGQNGLTLKVFGKLRYVVVINVLAAVLNFAVNLILIPKYGAMGAAIGTFSTMIIFNIMKQAGLRLGTGISIFDWKYLRTYVVITITALILLLIATLLHTSVYINIGLAVIGSVLVFRLNVHLLNVEKTFPELLKIPFARRLLGL